MGGRKGEERIREKEIQGKDGKGGEERNRAVEKGRKGEKIEKRNTGEGGKKDGGGKEEFKEQSREIGREHTGG